MGKLKLTRVELKRQKDSLSRFERYLPTLMLKKQQLQVEIRRVQRELEERTAEMHRLTAEVHEWAGVMAESADPGDFIQLTARRVGKGNIAGVDIPVFEGVEFEIARYDLYATPLWVDTAVSRLRDYATLKVVTAVLEGQRRALREELRITTQRVNLFEKVKIPETRENIRRIRIFLGDQQTAAVVRGKISKSKLAEAAS